MDKKSQRAYDENDLPIGEKEKYALYEIGKNMFTEAGYFDVGMDHFAATNDGLLISKKKNTPPPQFLWAILTNTEVLIGLGVSAISDVFLDLDKTTKQ